MSSDSYHTNGTALGGQGGEVKTEPTPGLGRKPYGAPRLMVHGSVRELTLGNRGSSADAMGKQRKVTQSERSVKQNIVRIGTHPLGIGLYLFEYRPGFRSQRCRHFGVMADEVEQVIPEAVSRGANGLRQVRHDLLGITDLAQQLAD